MEGAEEVGLVLSRASDLRSKIDRCILENAAERGVNDEGELLERREEDRDDDDAEQEEDSLIEVRDALESLEQQLSSLQALEQQQIYEKEAALAQIDRCRVFLLSKIRDHKGDLEVLQELSKFAGGNTEEDINGDGDLLLLPPYSSLVPETFILDGISASLHLHKNRKIPMNKSSTIEDQNESTESLLKCVVKGAGLVLGFVAKSTAGILAVLAVARLAGFEPRLMRKGRRPEPLVQCPPGRVMVVQEGVAQCVVKERVEVPFGSVGSDPVVGLGLG